MTTGPLTGIRVLVTRERVGELGRILAERGADVVHVPLIATRDPHDGGRALAAELSHLDDYHWVVVTSPAGAERVGGPVASHPTVRLAAVGTATAATLADLVDRPVDLVPHHQTAAALADALIEAAPRPMRVLVAQADRAGPDLVDALRAAGHDVTACVAYQTVLLRPDPELLRGVDVLTLASGSAARSWVDAMGTQNPPVVVAIGPSTARVARKLGLKVDGVAADHSLAGLVAEVERVLSRR